MTNKGINILIFLNAIINILMGVKDRFEVKNRKSDAVFGQKSKKIEGYVYKQTFWFGYGRTKKCKKPSNINGLRVFGTLGF